MRGGVGLVARCPLFRVKRKTLIFILRKFFGVILLAIAVNMFVNNISVIIASVPK